MKDKNKGATFWSCDDTIDYVTCTSPDEVARLKIIFDAKTKRC